MGNCSLASLTQKAPTSIRILKDDGEILKLRGPKPVQDFLRNFPGYGVFRWGRTGSPLGGSEFLLNGHVYYLLPLKMERNAATHESAKQMERREMEKLRRCNTNVGAVANLTGLEVLPSPGKGVWRVKVAMDGGQLQELLSENVNVEALVEELRMAARNESRMARRTQSSLGRRGSWKSPPLRCFQSTSSSSTQMKALV